MSTSEFEHIAREVSSVSSYIYLHVKGEPLFHPQLGEILSLCGKYGLLANLTTNGTLLPERGELLLSSPSLRQVNISLHSMEGRMEEQEKYLAGVAAFALDASKRGAPYVSLRMWNGEKGEDMSDSAARMLEFISARFGCDVGAGLRRGRDAAVFAPNVSVSFMDRFVWPDLALPVVSVRGRCLGGTRMLAILCDGTVTPCCLDSEGIIDLGNIFKSPLADIMSGERCVSLCRGFKGGPITEELCRRCHYRLRFDKTPDE